MRNDFMKRGEEAFALSAKIDSILQENGFWRSRDGSTFIHKSPDVRIVKKAGVRRGNILEFGTVERQLRDEGDSWFTKNVMRYEDFANAEDPMRALEQADSALPKPKPPKPTPLW